MNSNLPKFAMVMTSDDADVKRSAREVRAELQGVAEEASKTAPAFDAQAQAAERAAVASRELAKAAELGATAAQRTISGISSSADAALPSMERLINAFAGITAPAANRNGRMADIEAYGQKLDQLQAKFDPLFAAQQRYQQKLAEIAEAERYGAISASAAIDQRIREANSYNALVNNMDRLAMARKAAAEGIVAGQTITPDREADITAFFDQRDAARRQHDPRFAVLTAYREKLAEIRKDLRAGAIDQDVATAAIQRHRQAALATVAALKGRDGGGTGDRFRVQNLGYQVFDIAQSSALGMPLPMVAMQQLPQVIQLYAGQGGMNAALKDFGTIASGAAKLVTPLTVGVAGLTAVAGTGLLAWNGYLQSIKEVETAANGLGLAVAGSAREMEDAARNGAALAGISVSSARSMEAQFLRTGRIGSENFEKLIGLSKDFAATIGIDASEAGDALADMFADPARAAETLYQQYGLIDAATARQATNLARQNRQSEAQAILLDAMPRRLASAAEATTAWGRAWENVRTKASNTLDYIGQKIDQGASASSLEEQIRFAADRYQGLNSPWSMMPQFLVDGARREVDGLTEQKRLEERRAFDRQRQARDEAASRGAINIAQQSGANSTTLREQELRNEIAALESGLARRLGGRLPGADDTQTKMVEDALATKTRMLDALINQQGRLSELDRLDIQIQTERNPVLRAELEARRTRLQLQGDEVGGEKISADASRARNRVIMETTAGARAQAADMRAELETRAQLNSLVASGAITSAEANRMLQEELTLRPLIAAATSADAATKAELQRVIADLRDGYAGLAEQERAASAQQYLRSQQEKIEQLRVEQALIGANDNLRAETLARLEAEQEIRRRGYDTNGAIAQQIRAQLLEQAKLTREIERQGEAWDKVRGSGENAIDGIVDAIVEKDFDGLLETVTKDFSKTLLELGGANPLKNALLGTDHATIDDVGGLGGIARRLLGGGDVDPASLVSKTIGQSVGAMTVTAGTVMINGAVGGVPGLTDLTGLKGAAANDNSSVTPLAEGAGNPLGFVGNYKSGVDPRLTDILQKSALAFPGYKVDAMSGFRPGDPRFHGKGLATDVQLTDLASGKLLGNYQDAATFGTYERFAQTARAIQMRDYPELADKFRWGGYFGGGKGKYGAVDNMHFDLGGAGMAGGSWEGGLTSAQRALWPGIESKGNAAVAALGNVAKSSSLASEGLGVVGAGMGEFGKDLTNFFPAAPGGGSTPGGGGGFLGSIFGMLFSPQYRIAAGGGIGLYAKGGIADRPSIFGEAGAEAAVPLPDGRTIPVTLNVRQAYSRPQAYAGAVGSARNAPIINNYGNNQVDYQETTDESGNRQPVITIGEHVAAAVSQRGNPTRAAMQQNFGLRPTRISR